MLDHPLLRFVVLHLMEIKLISFAPPFMDNELKEQVQHISLEVLPSQSKITGAVTNTTETRLPCFQPNKVPTKSSSGI